MSIIIDFSQIYLAPIFVNADAKSCAQNPSDQSRDMLFHFAVNSVRSNIVMHKKKYGSNVIIACDGKSWRNEVFPYYKYSRKQSRKDDKSGLDWNFIFETGNYIREMMRNSFPFAVLHHERAEADDILGTMVRHLSTVTADEENIFGESEPEPILLISSDKDNFQLHRFKNVKQWSPAAKKLVSPDGKPEHALLEKIIRGDNSDGVPSIKCPDDWFTKDQECRAPSISKKYLDEFYKAKNPLDTCLNDQERVNFVRNRQLVDYDYTPKDIDIGVIELYNQQKAKEHSKMKLMSFLAKNRMNVLMSKIADFY